MTTRPLRLLALLMVLALVVGACGGGDDGDVATGDDDAEQVDGERADDSDGERDGGDDAAGADTPAGGDQAGGGEVTAGAAGSDGSGGTTADRGGAQDGAANSGSGGGTSAQAALQPTAPGRYHVSVNGSTKVGSQSQDMPDRTLEVRPPDGQRQVQITTADDGSSRTEMELQFADDGVRLHRISISQQGVAKTFSFSPPVLAAPATARVGQKWSWSGTSDDGATTVEASFEVLETGVPVTVGGDQVNTVKVRSITTTSGDLESTSTDVQWVSPEHRLIVKTKGSSKGQYQLFSFESHYTWQLDSVRPS